MFASILVKKKVQRNLVTITKG